MLMNLTVLRRKLFNTTQMEMIRHDSATLLKFE